MTWLISLGKHAGASWRRRLTLRLSSLKQSPLKSVDGLRTVTRSGGSLVSMCAKTGERASACGCQLREKCLCLIMLKTNNGLQETAEAIRKPTAHLPRPVHRFQYGLFGQPDHVVARHHRFEIGSISMRSCLDSLQCQTSAIWRISQGRNPI